MKILLVNKYLYYKGGSESYMFALAELLRRQGNDVCFWGMSDVKNIVADKDGDFAPNVDYGSSGRAAHRIKAGLSSIYSRQNRRRLSVVLKKFRPDIVHVHNYNFQLTPAILPAIKESGAGVVHTMHDAQLACPCHRFYSLSCNAVCTLCAHGGFWHCIRRRCFEGSLLKSALGTAESYFYHAQNYYNRYIDAFISPSSFLAGHVAGRLARSVFIVPNFTHDKGCADTPGRRRDYVLYFGRISSGKGIIEAQDQFIQAKIKLVIIGSGPQQDLLKRSQYIEYLGPKQNDELMEYISGARFVIQPSRQPENCPMAVIESFMCSTPVIASPCGGLNEMIRDGKNGFLIDFDDPAQAGRLHSILQTDTSAMRARCRADYLEKYSPQKHLDQISRIYDGVLNGAH